MHLQGPLEAAGLCLAGPGILHHKLAQGYIGSLALCHNILHRGLDDFDIPQHVILVWHISDIMLIGSGQLEVASVFAALERYKWIKE